jgi:hypothetical protein
VVAVVVTVAVVTVALTELMVRVVVTVVVTAGVMGDGSGGDGVEVWRSCCGRVECVWGGRRDLSTSCPPPPLRAHNH